MVQNQGLIYYIRLRLFFVLSALFRTVSQGVSDRICLDWRNGFQSVVSVLLGLFNQKETF